MSEIVLSETFFAKCNESRESLQALFDSFDRNFCFGINNNQSEVCDTVERTYGLLYNSIKQTISTLYADWNVIEICGNNIATIDRFLGACVAGDNTQLYYSYECDGLWTGGDAYDVDLGGTDVNESSLPSYRSEDSWIITYSNIIALGNMIPCLDAFITTCDDYQRILEEFRDSNCITGALADAINRYIDNIHVVLINILRSVAGELKDAINQYCISYYVEFPESGYYLNRRELNNDINELANISSRYESVISRARRTINSARGSLNTVGVVHPYNPSSINAYYPNAFLGRISEAITRISRVIDTVDANEARGRSLADDAELDVLRIRASVDSITPIGGHRVLHYRDENASNLLDVINSEDDVLNIECEEVVYRSEAEYVIESIQNADASELQSEIEVGRIYLSSLLPDGVEISDTEVINWVEYYQYLIDAGWTSEQAESIAIYALTNYLNLLSAGDYSALDGTAVATCPAPCVVTSNAVSFAERIANDEDSGYDQITRDGGVDYDCSSLVMHAYIQAGVPGLCVDENGMYSYSTVRMQEYFDSPESLFEHVGSSADGMRIEDLQPGDILLCDGHTEIYVGNGYSVSARSNLGAYDSENIDADYYHYGYTGDSASSVDDDTDANINDPSTLDVTGEIRFESDINSNGYLNCVHTPPWEVYRYTGVPQGDI